MRDYSKISPLFWTGDTGKKLRGYGDAQRLAFYFITCPSANMIGLYYLPLPTLLHEIGIPLQGASKALRRVEEADFAYYDTASEYVWVPRMALFQIGATLSPKDNRHKGLLRELENHRKSPFFKHFRELYEGRFSIPPVLLLESPFEAPSKPLRSQEQEQEQEKEQEQEIKTPFGRFTNVILSQVEYLELETRFNGSLAGKIEALSEYMASKGKKYKSHYATILAWDRKNGNERYKTKADRTAEVAARMLARFDTQNIGSGERGSCGGDDRRLPGDPSDPLA